MSGAEQRDVWIKALPELAEAWKVREQNETERTRINAKLVVLPNSIFLLLIVGGILTLAGYALAIGRDQIATTLVGYAAAIGGGYSLGRRGGRQT